MSKLPEYSQLKEVAKEISEGKHSETNIYLIFSNLVNLFDDLCESGMLGDSSYHDLPRWKCVPPDRPDGPSRITVNITVNQRSE